MIALAHIAKCRPGEIGWTFVEFLQAHDLARLMQGQRIEQDRIYNAEYGGVRPNSKRSSHHRQGRKPWSLPQPAKLVAQVLKQRFHSVQAHPGCRHLN